MAFFFSLNTFSSHSAFLVPPLSLYRSLYLYYCFLSLSLSVYACRSVCLFLSLSIYIFFSSFRLFYLFRLLLLRLANLFAVQLSVQTIQPKFTYSTLKMTQIFSHTFPLFHSFLFPPSLPPITSHSCTCPSSATSQTVLKSHQR